MAYGEEQELFKILSFDGFVSIINQILSQTDLVLIDQLMFLMGNITGTSRAIRQQVRSNIDLISAITTVLTQAKSLPKIFAKNYAWVASNLSEEASSLSIKDISGLMVIFCEFFEVFSTKTQDVDALLDITKGLSNLSAFDNERSLRLVSGLGLRPEIGSTLIAQMSDLLINKDAAIQSHCVRYMGGIMSSEDANIVDKALESNVIDRITNILFQQQPQLVKEALWTLSNIAASRPSALIKNSQTIKRIVALADDSGSTTDAAESYEQSNVSVAFAATDDLSVSYEIEKSEVSRLDDTATEQQSKAIQLAYTMGGMTLAVSHASHDNNGYVLDANTEQTLFAVTMAF